MTQIYGWRNPHGVTDPTRISSRAKKSALGLGILLSAVVLLSWPELPRWRNGGVASTPSSSVTYLPQALACPSEGTVIAIIGDSHVAGGRIGAGGSPFGVVFEKTLAGRVTVRRYGIGGQTAEAGEARWRGRDLDDANLIILGFGTNDAAPRGWLGNKVPVPVTAFKASLVRQINIWRAGGKDVALLVPPPGGSPAITARLEPYRAAARDVGRATDTPVLDPTDAFASCPKGQPVLTSDALHMSAAGHRCLGTWLANQFCPPTR